MAPWRFVGGSSRRDWHLTGLVVRCYVRRTHRRRRMPRRQRVTPAVLALVALLVLPGCVKPSIIPDEPDTITIRVSNNNPLDMTVYALNQTMRVRLGTVTTASSQEFTVSLHQVSPTGDLQLLADPVGSRRTLTSETIHVS